MKLFAATSETQNVCPNDFHFCTDGEIVTPPTVICATDWEFPDGGCGCGRSWIGVDNHQGTTTAIIVEREITFEDYANIINISLKRAGWSNTMVVAEAIATRGATIADQYPVGTIFGHTLGILYIRDIPETDILIDEVLP